MMLATPTTQATLQTAACQQTHRTLCQRNRRCSAACSIDQPCFRSPTPVDRRSVSLNLLGLLCQAAICVPALAKPSPSNKEVDDNTSALVQGLLAKSKANKDRYTKERLNDYYRRNFKDYFSYEKGLGQTSNGRGVSDENQQKILQWLKDNP